MKRSIEKVKGHRWGERLWVCVVEIDMGEDNPEGDAKGIGEDRGDGIGDKVPRVGREIGGIGPREWKRDKLFVEEVVCEEEELPKEVIDEFVCWSKALLLFTVGNGGRGGVEKWPTLSAGKRAGGEPMWEGGR